MCMNLCEYNELYAHTYNVPVQGLGVYLCVLGDLCVRRAGSSRVCQKGLWYYTEEIPWLDGARHIQRE